MKKSIDSDIYEIISRNIRKYRIMAGMSQEELAMKADYTHQYIRKIEAPNVKKSLSLHTLYQIAKALDINISCLFDDCYDELVVKKRITKNDK